MINVGGARGVIRHTTGRLSAAAAPAGSAQLGPDPSRQGRIVLGKLPQHAEDLRRSDQREAQVIGGLGTPRLELAVLDRL